ncbi:hypothetical protein Tco_1028086 [Tanacetum coccineum]
MAVQYSIEIEIPILRSDHYETDYEKESVKDKPQFGVVLLRNRRVLVVILLGVSGLQGIRLRLLNMAIKFLTRNRCLNKVSAVKDKAGVDKAPVVVKDKADVKGNADVVKDKPTNVVKDKADVVKAPVAKDNDKDDVVKAPVAKDKDKANVVKDKPTNVVKDKADVVKAAVAKDKDKADVVKAPVAKNKEKAHVVKVPVAKDKDKVPADVFVNGKAPTDVVNEIQVCHKDIVLALFLYKSNKNVIGLISRN